MKKAAKPKSFEQAMQELDDIIAKMEDGSLTLDDMLAAYKRGAALTRFCRSKLESAQMEIKKLDGSELSDFGSEHD